MKLQQFLLGLGAAAVPDQSHNNVAPALWDGKCFYPQADASFKLDTYPGRWYQLAGTLAPFTAGCKCISARYDINVSLKLCVTSHQATTLTLRRTTGVYMSTTPAREGTSRLLSKARLSPPMLPTEKSACSASASQASRRPLATAQITQYKVWRRLLAGRCKT